MDAQNVLQVCYSFHFSGASWTFLAKDLDLIMIPFLGGFYSDDVGYVAKSCKKCPDGSFVSYDKAPGTRKQDCISCPEGKTTISHLLMMTSR